MPVGGINKDVCGAKLLPIINAMDCMYLLLSLSEDTVLLFVSLWKV